MTTELIWTAQIRYEPPRLSGPSQDHVLACVERLAAARLAVRDLPGHRPLRRIGYDNPKIDRAHDHVLAMRAESRAGGGKAGRKKVAKAQLAEMLVCRRAGYGSYEDYRRACKPRSSLTSTAYVRLQAYRELAHAEVAWQRTRHDVLGSDFVIDLTGDRAELIPG